MWMGMPVLSGPGQKRLRPPPNTRATGPAPREIKKGGPPGDSQWPACLRGGWLMGVNHSLLDRMQPIAEFRNHCGPRLRA